MSTLQVQKAIDYLEDNLSGEVSLEACAGISGYSFWHFQRIFKSSVGETIKAYLRKRRLSEAALRISQSNIRLLDLALEYGFESQESFTRAFKKEFSVTPGKVRAKDFDERVLYKRARITAEYLNHLYGGVTMSPKLVNIEEKRILGKSDKFISVLSEDKNNFTIIPALWDKYLPQRKIPGRTSNVEWGVIEILPEGKQSHPQECWYMAGCEVSQDSDIPTDFEEKIVPAGKYAVFTHKGKLDALEHTYNYIFGSWIPQNNVKLRQAPDLELYDGRFHPTSPESEIDIYIPVE